MEILAGEILMKLPGAFIRWVFFRKRRSFNEVLKDDAYNYIVSMLFIAIIIVTIIFVK